MNSKKFVRFLLIYRFESLEPINAIVIQRTWDKRSYAEPELRWLQRLRCSLNYKSVCVSDDFGRKVVLDQVISAEKQSGK